MSRLARLDAVGVLQHVMVRGIEKRNIFLDDHDRQCFLDRFSRLLVETETSCFAWTLLSNHFHILLRPQKTKLSVFMRRLLTSYAVFFNLRHKRVGHLFQNRYKSVVCEDEPYLLELIRYIHLNPVRAGMVRDGEGLEKYPWSGHSILMGQAVLPGQAITEVLARFGKDQFQARENYKAFVLDAIDVGHRDEFSGGGMARSCVLSGSKPGEEYADPRILGSGDFVEELWDEQEIICPERSVSLELVLGEVAKGLNIELAHLCRPNKKRGISDARAVTCYLAVRECGISGIAVSKRLGITPAGVTMAAQRGEALAKTETFRDIALNLKILRTSL